MPYKDKERKREANRLYREVNREKLKATKRAWQIANRAKISARELELYHLNPAPFKERYDRYVAKKIEETGVHPSAARSRKAHAADPEGVRKRKRDYARNSYHADPEIAAKRRAQFCLAQSTGLPSRALPKELIEAKAAQLLVKRAVKSVPD